MSGILNNRQRIIDAILTLEGRRQAAAGDLRIEFYSFTDAGTYYRADEVSGSADATQRLYLEACHLPQDQITFEADDSGLLKPFANSLGNTVKDGHIISYSFEATTSSLLSGASENTTILSGQEFASTAGSLLNESLTNFCKLQSISSKDRLFEDDGFGVGNTEMTFTIHNKRPIPNKNHWVANLNEVESLFNDPRLNNLPNFKYLPPINRVNDDDIDKTDYRDTWRHHLGHYWPWGRTSLIDMDYDQIMSELQYFEDTGYCKVVKFDPTSQSNRLMIQMFEQGFSTLKKLDVVDFGQLRTGNPASPLAHIFFVGKVMIDDYDRHTFIHLFTLVFE